MDLDGDTQIVLALQGGIPWAIFDDRFYAGNNPAAAGLVEPNRLLEHYLAEGARAGYAPNRWFDEAFYCTAHPEVAALIRSGEFASGFEHYCQLGYRTHAPHWLFDPAFYREQNPGLTEAALQESDFVNLYDHYLKFGAVEGRHAHPFFDPRFYVAGLDADQAAACGRSGAYAHFLTRGWQEASEPRVSPAFDPAWYRHTCQEVVQQVAAGMWHSALHHYLLSRGIAPAPSRIKVNIDRPRIVDGQTVEPMNGHLDIIGWAAADHPIAAVEVFIDDEHCGLAHHGIRTEGVAATFPELTHSLFSGFRFVGPTQVAPGRHRLRIVARGKTGLEASEAFEIDVKPPPEHEGMWSVRRRLRVGEAEFKLGLLRDAGTEPTFVIAMARSAQPDSATQRTLACLERQIYRRWHLQDAQPVSEPATEDRWLVQLDPGDEPGVDALLELALHRLAQPVVDFIYSDERRLDPATGVIAPFFKPDWSADLLLSTNYIGRLWAASAALAARAGVMAADLAHRSGFDLVLRLTEHARRIGHVPRVLCAAAAPAASAVAEERAALARALERRGIRGAVTPGGLPHIWRVRRDLVERPKVSIIIPTAGKGGLIETALRTLRATTDYPALEVIVIDTAVGVPGPWRDTVRRLADRVIEDGERFNWSRLNNRAARLATGDMLLFLNDDVAFTDPEWLVAMLENGQRPEVGVVGPLLLYPDGIIQEAGMFLTETGGSHAFHGLPGTAPGPFGLALTQRDVIAVTGACLMVRRGVFERLGGFDEAFDIINNDLDFCLRCEAAGLAVVFTPHASVVHHEGVSRVGLPEAANERRFVEVWRERLREGDPWFNRNLSRGFSDYRVEVEPSALASAADH